MDEYIEREALMRQIKEIHCADCDSYHGVRCRACWVDDTLNYIDIEPAADVEPVRHGRWVNTHSDSEFVQCSLCKYPVYAAWNVTNYCPNCGAKMKGDG